MKLASCGQLNGISNHTESISPVLFSAAMSSLLAQEGGSEELNGSNKKSNGVSNKLVKNAQSTEREHIQLQAPTTRSRSRVALGETKREDANGPVTEAQQTKDLRSRRSNKGKYNERFHKGLYRFQD